MTHIFWLQGAVSQDLETGECSFSAAMKATSHDGGGKQYLLCQELSLYLSFMQLSRGMSIEIHFSSFAGFFLGHSSLLRPLEAVTVGVGKHSEI